MRNETDSRLVSSPSGPALEVRELVKTFGGRRVVNGVSFELQRGEIFGFLGPNGLGKTTTMRMALDLIRPDSGSVALLGGMPTRRALKRVGYLPEERGLFQRARVLDASDTWAGSRAWRPKLRRGAPWRCWNGSACQTVCARRSRASRVE